MLHISLNIDKSKEKHTRNRSNPVWGVSIQSHKIRTFNTVFPLKLEIDTRRKRLKVIAKNYATFALNCKTSSDKLKLELYTSTTKPL